MPTLSADMLLMAYRRGLFPMSERRDDPEIFWIEPRQRGILPLESLHVSRSLRKAVRHAGLTVTCDHAFTAIIDLCAAPTPTRPESWINATIRAVFIELYQRGAAHSVEVWQEDRLVGGLYGLALGGAFFGESMVSRVTDASKIALVHLVGHLRRGGFVLLDTQFLTSHLASLGGIEIARRDYLRRLLPALEVEAVFYPELAPDPLPWVARDWANMAE